MQKAICFVLPLSALASSNLKSQQQPPLSSSNSCWGCYCLYTQCTLLILWNCSKIIVFLDELGNFKQKKFTLQNVKFFYILKQQNLCCNLRINYHLSKETRALINLNLETWKNSVIYFLCLSVHIFGECVLLHQNYLQNAKKHVLKHAQG